MKTINYEIAQRFNISADHWIICAGNKKVFDDFVAFCNQQGLILPYGMVWQESHYKVFKVPVDKNNKIVERGGNITIMGPVYRAIGITYDPYQFMKDYVEDEQKENGNEEQILEKRTIIQPDTRICLVKRDGYGFEKEKPILVERFGLLYDIVGRIEIDTDEDMKQVYNTFLKHEDNPKFKYGVFEFRICFKGIKTKLFEMYFAVKSLDLGDDFTYDDLKTLKLPDGFKLMPWLDYVAQKYNGMRIERLGQDDEKMKPFLVPTGLCLQLDKALPEIVEFAIEQGCLSNFDIAQKFELGFLRRHYILTQLIGLGFVSEDCDLGPGKRSVFITQQEYDEIFKKQN